MSDGPTTLQMRQELDQMGATIRDRLEEMEKTNPSFYKALHAVIHGGLPELAKVNEYGRAHVLNQIIALAAYARGCIAVSDCEAHGD